MAAKKKNTSLRELRQELKKRKSLEVEIMSLSTATVLYECPKTGYKFRLEKVGAKESVELDVLTTLVNRSRGFFENHLITMIDFEDDVYTVQDLITYLGLQDLYNGIENTDIDYVDAILEKDNYDFEKFLETQANPSLVKRVAERAIFKYQRGQFDSHSKRKILSNKLGMEDLFDVIDADLENNR